MADNLDMMAEQAANPDLVAYRDPATGTIQFYPKTANAEKLKSRGLETATPDDVARRASLLHNTTVLGQITAAGKLAARTATFGLTNNSPEDSQQIKDFATVSPTLSTLTKVAGAAAPAVVTGGLLAPEAGAAGVMAELGAASRAAQIGATVAEEAAGNAAWEIEDAKEGDRDISIGNIALGMGLGAGLTTVARYARGALRRAPEDLLSAAEHESNTFARGERQSAERRSVGAASANEGKYKPATASEVETYAQNPKQYHDEVNQVSHDALADAFTGHEGVTGTSGGAARQVHGLAFKEQDVLPHMLDVDPEIALDAVYKHAEAAMHAADILDTSGQKLAARRLRAASEAAITGLQDADAEMIGAKGAVGLNRLKQEADDVLSTYLRNKSVTARSAAKEISKFVEPLRTSLEDSKTWGSFWAERQVGENRLWSGDNGIIQLSNIWQPEVFESVKGRARVAVGDALSEVANRTPRADIAEHVMGLPRIKANKVLSAWESTLDQWNRMTQLKEESGLTRQLLEDGSNPVDTLKASIEQQRQMIEELRFLRDVGPRAKPITDKLAARGPAKAQAELLFEGMKHVPGVGHAVKAAEHLSEAVTGKSISERLFKPEPLPAAGEITRESALRNISERQAGRGKTPSRERGPQGGPVMPASAPPTKPGPGVPRGPIGGFGGPLAGGAALLGGAALMSNNASAAPITETLGRISDNAKAIQERAALGLVVKESRPPKLEPLAVRFKGDSSNLVDAYQSKLANVRYAVENPQAFVNGMTDTYGAMAGDHGRLFQQLVARVQIGAQYMLANAPPSVGLSMVRPDGIAPDSLAIMQWAAMYSGVFTPGDVVYDVATGDATPTQIRALREVHPDIYGGLRASALKQIGQVGQKVPFETLRTLDVLFDMPGVGGLAFSDGMTATMAGAFAQKTQNSARQSLSGESVIAPSSATKALANGPSTLQG